MADVLKLQFKVDDKASPEIKKLQRQLGMMEVSTQKASKSFLGLDSSLLKLGATYLSITGAMSLGRDFVRVADSVTIMESRLNLATNSLQEFNTAQTELYKISQLTRTGLGETVDLFERVTRSTRDYGTSQEEILDLTETINKAMIISGGTAESMNASIIQLGQAFSADFQSVGQELASIREQTPRLYQALLEGTGKTSKEFKKLAEDGKLSTQIIIDALKSQASAVDSEFGKVGRTIDQSMTQAENAITIFVGTLDDAFSVSETLSGAIDTVTESIESLTSVINSSKPVTEIINADILTAQAQDIQKEINQLQALLDKQANYKYDNIGGLMGWLFASDTMAENQLKTKQDQLNQINAQLRNLAKTNKSVSSSGGDKEILTLPIGLTLDRFAIDDLDREIEAEVEKYASKEIPIILGFQTLVEQQTDVANEWALALERYPNDIDEVNKFYLDKYEALNKDNVDALSEVQDFARQELGKTLASVLNNFAQGQTTSISGLATGIGASATSYGAMYGATQYGTAGFNPYLAGGTILGGMALQSLGSSGLFGGGSQINAVEVENAKIQENINNALSDFNDGLKETAKTLELFGNTGSSISEQILLYQNQLNNAGKGIVSLFAPDFISANFTDIVTEELLNSLYEKYNITPFERIGGLQNIGYNVSGSTQKLDELRLLFGEDVVENATTSIARYENAFNGLSDFLSENIASMLDYSLLTTQQLNELVGDFDQSSYEKNLNAINEIALAVKQNAGIITDDQKDALIELYDTNFIKGQDYADAIDLLDDKNQEFIDIITSMGDSINDTIDSIRGNLLDDSDTTDLIRRYNETQQIITSLASRGIDTTDYVQELTGLATSISSSAFGNSTNLNNNLIQSLEQTKLDIGFRDEVVKVNIVGSELTDTTTTPTVFVANQTSSSNSDLEAIMIQLLTNNKLMYDILQDFQVNGVQTSTGANILAILQDIQQNGVQTI